MVNNLNTSETERLMALNTLGKDFNMKKLNHKEVLGCMKQSEDAASKMLDGTIKKNLLEGMLEACIIYGNYAIGVNTEGDVELITPNNPKWEEFITDYGFEVNKIK